MQPGEETLTAKEIAAKYKIDVATVYRKVKSGEWPALRVGNRYRFYASEVDERIRSFDPWRRSARSVARRENEARKKAT